jgi:hypothetical protein
MANPWTPPAEIPVVTTFYEVHQISEVSPGDLSMSSVPILVSRLYELKCVKWGIYLVYLSNPMNKRNF